MASRARRHPLARKPPASARAAYTANAVEAVGEAVDEEAADELVRTQDRGQLARRSRIGDPLRNLRAIQRHTIKEAQRTHRLVDSRPGNPLRNEIDLKRADVFEPEPLRDRPE